MPTKVCMVKPMVFPVVVCGCERWTIKKAECWRIDAFELWLEKTLESPVDSKEIKAVNPKGNQSWIFTGRTDSEAVESALATWFKELTYWKRPWCWERLRARGVGGRGWDSWMASPTRWTWVWAISRRWRRTGKPGMLQFMGLQKVGHDLATEQQQHSTFIECLLHVCCSMYMKWQPSIPSSLYVHVTPQIKAGVCFTSPWIWLTFTTNM